MNMLATNTIIDKTQQADVFELDKTVKLEMKASTLKRLLETRQVCATDFHCLDCSSKQCIKQLCLQTCLRCLS
jgi:hypothetical protein